MLQMNIRQLSSLLFKAIAAIILHWHYALGELLVLIAMIMTTLVVVVPRHAFISRFCVRPSTSRVPVALGFSPP